MKDIKTNLKNVKTVVEDIRTVATVFGFTAFFLGGVCLGRMGDRRRT
jgi:hypothetical protein